MKKMCVSLAATLAIVLSAAAASAAPKGQAEKTQTEQGILVDTIRANRKAFVAVNLELNAEEAKTFWPLYDKYQAEMIAIQDRAVAIIEEYTSTFRDLPDDKAVQLMESWLTTESERVQVRRRTSPSSPRSCRGGRSRGSTSSRTRWTPSFATTSARAIPVIDEKAGAKAK